MLRSLNDLEEYRVSATDGELGRVANVILDDERWTVRYLAFQTGGSLFLNGQRVLISPLSFRRIDWSARRFHVAMTMEKIKNSPEVDVEQPVSRQHEPDYHAYGFPSYWKSRVWGAGDYTGLLAASDQRPDSHPNKSGDVHLRSAKEIRGYHIQGSDESIGHIEDFMVDDEAWNVRYLVINTSNWWFGKKVLISPRWANRVSWEEQKVYVDMSRREVKDSPEWNATAAIHREFEERLHEYYARPAYWSGGQTSKETLPSA